MELFAVVNEEVNSLMYHLIIFAALFVLIIILLNLSLSKQHRHVYLVDFVCYRAPDSYRVPIPAFIEHIQISGSYTPESVDFQRKLLLRSGMGNETYVPEGSRLLPANPSFTSAMDETRTVLFTLVRDLFLKTKHTNLDPKSVDILVTNCSINCPTPSISAMIVHEFGLRSDVRSFSLSGMGCSAGILAVSLAKDLLSVQRNSTALVLSTETICSALYSGKTKSMLLPNCLFRMGGAALLLSNKKSDRKKAKYELQYVVRTHFGAKDSAYKCVYQETDEENHTGVALSRNVVQVAGEALKMNMGILGPLVLPYSEQLLYVLWILLIKGAKWLPAKKRGQQQYVPDFKKAFEHFCIHAGGRAVIDVIKDQLKLSDKDIEASKMTLYRFGNTSSSSTWYSLCYLEAKGRVKRGDRVWQMCFGSGFKCNSAVWKRIGNGIPKNGESNAWSDRIHLYPVDVPEVDGN